MPLDIGVSASCSFPGAGTFSFTLSDSALLSIKISGIWVREFKVYRDSTIEIGGGNTNAITFIHGCPPGRYRLTVASGVVGIMDVKIIVDTLDINSWPLIEANQRFYSYASASDTVHYFRVNIPELSVNNLNRFGDGSGNDPKMTSVMWSPDTTKVLFGSDWLNIDNVLNPIDVLSKGVYPIMFKKFYNYRPYSYEINSSAIKSGETEPNSTFESADSIALNDSLRGSFSKWNDGIGSDSLDYYRFELDNEYLTTLTVGSYMGSITYELYLLTDSLELVSFGSKGKNILLGRLGKGMYYLKLTGNSCDYKVFVNASTAPTVKSISIDTTHLLNSVLFDKKQYPFNLSQFSYTTDRNLYPQKAASFVNNGFVIRPKITDFDNFSISFWTYLQKSSLVTGFQTLVSIGSVSTTHNSSLMFVFNLNGALEIYSENNLDQTVQTIPSTITSGWREKWSHFAITSKNRQLTLYVNGKIVLQDVIKAVENYDGINFGQINSTKTNWKYTGCLDDILIFDCPLDSQSVIKLIDIEIPAKVKKFGSTSLRPNLDSDFQPSVYSLLGQRFSRKLLATQLIVKKQGPNISRGTYVRQIKIKP